MINLNIGKHGFANMGPGTALVTQRKHLKLSIGENSDISFNNVSIKSGDKNNSISLGNRGMPLSAKNGSILIN